MSKRRKLTDEERISAVQEYLKGKGSYITIADKYKVNERTIRDLVRRAKSEGIDNILSGSPNKKYDIETKVKAVEDYLSKKGSQTEICAKYKISARSILQRWIKWYNGNKDLKEQLRSGRGITMKKGRKTTHEERVEIVAFCVENGKNYDITTEKYGVSYQQIYSWVRKYEAKGVEGLIDRRGKAKPEDELTEADRLRMENKILQAKIKDQEMEIAILKKLKELERGW